MFFKHFILFKNENENENSKSQILEIIDWPNCVASKTWNIGEDSWQEKLK